MSDRPDAIPPIPAETARAARAIFGSNNFYLVVGNELGKLLGDIRTEFLTPPDEATGRPIPHLALVTFFQYREELSDRQAADALRSRLDWKYALHLPPLTAALPANDLCYFRCRFLHQPNCQQEFERLVRRLSRLAGTGPLGEQAPPAGAIVAQLCRANRSREVYCSTRTLIEALARTHPRWLGQIALPHWYTVYHGPAPLSLAAKEASTVPADALYLLHIIQQAAPSPVLELPEVEALSLVCRQQLDWSQPDEVRFLPACWLCYSVSQNGSVEEDEPLPHPSHEVDEESSESRGTAHISGG